MLRVPLLLLCLAGTVCAQDHFEVASVKRNDASPLVSPMSMRYQPDRFVAQNFPLLPIITEAYQLPGNLDLGLLVGVPAWVNTERYDIEAIAAVPAGLGLGQLREKMNPMLRNLLQERFKLSMRVERVEKPVFAIEANRNGTKLTPAAIVEKDCPPFGYELKGQCHRISGSLRDGMHGEAVSVGDIAKFVANYTDRPVVDKSGIEGLFAIDTPGWRPMNAPATRVSTGAGEEQLPNLFELFEKLGLKLVADKAVVDTYVMEKIERPTEN